MISQADYFGHFSTTDPITNDLKANAAELLLRVNALLVDCAPAGDVATMPALTSGYRPAWYNARVPGAAVKSRHMTAQAIDLADPDGALDAYLDEHPNFLIYHALYREHPLATKNWCHLQTTAPASGNRTFIP